MKTLASFMYNGFPENHCKMSLIVNDATVSFAISFQHIPT